MAPEPEQSITKNRGKRESNKKERKMVQKERIYTTLKYMGAFLLCTVCFCVICSFWETVDYDNPEFKDCFELQNGYIIKEVLFDADHVYCNYPQVCACVSNNTYIMAFYTLALLVIMLYEWLRRKIISNKYRLLCALGDVFIWSSLYYLILNSSFHWSVRLEYTCKFMAPMAIIMLLLNCLPQKALKYVSIIIGTIYGLYVGFWGVIIISNLLRVW